MSSPRSVLVGEGSDRCLESNPGPLGALAEESRLPVLELDLSWNSLLALACNPYLLHQVGIVGRLVEMGKDSLLNNVFTLQEHLDSNCCSPSQSLMTSDS